LTKQLALIERNLLIDKEAGISSSAVSAAVRLHRAGWHILLLAERPERWRPTRKTMDQAMSLQGKLHEALTEAGGDLDGICYMDSGLFVQKKSRHNALEEVADRYGVSTDQLTVISGQSRDLESALAIGARAIATGTDNPPAGSRQAGNLKEAAATLLK